ncbi:MAG: DUF2059 domain-containing protein [Verrucomicrobiota bacterium JB022]|nr:DUF2059 domain-containing protein [Verrucomicrobiota bacterium JB022]
MKRFTLCLLMALACVRPATAAEPSRVTPQELQLAEQLLETINADESMKQVMEQYSSVLKNGLLQSALGATSSQADSQAVANEFANWFEEAMAWENFAPKIQEAYAQAYTGDELKQLIAFYQSDIGQKLLERQPELTRRSMEIGKQYMEQLMPELQARLQTAQAQVQASQLKQVDEAQKTLEKAGVTGGLRGLLPKKDK